jgi:MFS family permease
MHESPAFAKAKSEGKTATNPLKESFGNKYNLKFVLLALFGATMGQGVVWYTGQFYAMNFLKTVQAIESSQVDMLLGIALILGTPFFVVFGWLSDKWGRKSIMMLGMILAIFSYRPIYRAMYASTDLTKKTELVDQTKVVPSVKEIDATKMDSIYTTTKAYTDGTTVEEIKTIHFEAGKVMLDDKGKDKIETKVTKTINSSDKWFLVLMVFIQVIFVTMVYGPIAAFLVEMFPTKIRYTSMSLPYHIGNGVFGGLLPAVATYLATNAKTSGKADWYLEGLWYPIGVAAVCLVIGVIYINGKDKEIND